LAHNSHLIPEHWLKDARYVGIFKWFLHYQQLHEIYTFSSLLMQVASFTNVLILALSLSAAFGLEDFFIFFVIAVHFQKMCAYIQKDNLADISIWSSKLAAKCAWFNCQRNWVVVLDFCFSFETGLKKFLDQCRLLLRLLVTVWWMSVGDCWNKIIYEKYQNQLEVLRMTKWCTL